MEILSHGSFPRSGNHLLDTVLKFSYPSNNVHWVEHNAWLSDKTQNFICVVRQPSDAICSWILLSSDNRYDRSDRLLNWYIRYHEYMLNKKDVLLINFDQLISNPSCVNKLIYDKYNIKNVYDIPKDFYDVYMKFSYPENSPIDKRGGNKAIINEIKQSSEYADANKIYKKILKRIKNEF